MKQLIILFAILIGMMLFVYWSSKPGNLENLVSRTTTSIQTTQGQEKTVKIGDNKIVVSVAKTDEERRVGLSGRDSLIEGSGMLFVLEPNIKPSFWMKGVKFPLDIIWIDDGKVVEVTPDIQPVDASTMAIPTYAPTKPADYALEIPAGEAKEKNIKAGDKVELPAL
ncbi:MAG: DUF192 domain-containing protein [Candidatus Blackburnbacteria bacterium]|nr:DUF192 domain-containing protein [Candidatus Blackburnbacteria bacterium]